MAIPKQTFTWPITGGLDTQKSPLVVQPGSALQLDNVIQPRLNEWRRRNGMTQSATDTWQADFFHVSKLGDQGVFASALGYQGQYRGSLSSNRWSYLPGTGTESTTRVPVMATDKNVSAFAAAGNLRLVGTVDAFTVYDAVANTQKYVAASGYLRVRAAGTSAHLALFGADSGGNLTAFVVDIATGVVTSSVIKTGLHTTQPYLDAMWYGGSTITVVARSSSSQIFFMEFNPSTAALATNVTITTASTNCQNCLALIPDPSASGNRLVGTSGTTSGNTTRVLVANSAGTVASNDQVEAVLSSQITGVGTGTVNWSILYRTTTPELKFNDKSGGVVGTPTNIQNNTWGSTAYISSQAWRDTTDGNNYRCLLGMHTGSDADPQDSWVECRFAIGAAGIFDVTNHPVPNNAAAPFTDPACLYQVVRTGTRTFEMALPVLAHFEDNAGVLSRRYSLDIFTEVLLTSAEIGTVNMGPPVQYKQTTFTPVTNVSFPDQGWMQSLGTRQIPRQLTLVATSGGSKTPSATYGYVGVFEILDADGNLWRSPISEPQFVTLGASDTRVLVSWSCPWRIEGRDIDLRLALYATDANGSLYRRFATVSAGNGGGVSGSIYDAATDITIGKGEVLYTEGELETMLTPPASHLALFGDRLWLVNRDYRTELCPSRNLRPGRQPEFVAEGVLDLDDAFGDITGISSLDDNGVVFKKNAIYFIQGEGLSDSGTGQVHNYVQVSSDVGAIAGSPIVAAGDKLYFVSERGIHSIDRARNIEFIGSAVDQYLHQPDVQTVEVVYDACFVPSVNEVRFVTTNYVLVYNRIYNTWTRWTGLAGMKRCLVVNGVMWLFRASDGTIWKEGTSAQTTDQGTAFTGVIRSPWMRPSFGPSSGDGFKQLPAQNGLRLYRSRAIYSRTTGGSNATLIGKIYLNNDDTQVETFTSAAIAGATLSGTGEMVPQNQKCTSFSVALILPSGDITVRVEGFSAACGPRSGSMPLASGNRWA